MAYSYDEIRKFWETNITYLKGVGPTKAVYLQKYLNITSFEDLIFLFPKRYKDKSRLTPPEELIFAVNKEVLLRGTLKNFKQVPARKKKFWEADFVMERKIRVKLRWFKMFQFVSENIQKNLNKEVLIYGKPTYYGKQLSINHPEIYSCNSQEDLLKIKRLHPVYTTREDLIKRGLSSKKIQELIGNLLKKAEGYFYEIIPSEILETYFLKTREEAFRLIHFPSTLQDAEKGLERFKFEEIFLLQILLQQRRRFFRRQFKAPACPVVGELFHKFYENYLPFELTNAQKRVVKEIRKDMRREEPMSRLVQGDVGSGKTMVAFLSCLIALDNGLQCAIMAPTEVLANQHYAKLLKSFVPMGISVRLLTGSMTKAQKKAVKSGLKLGTIQVVVGTHALIQEDVEFKNLGLVVVDEQHKFGVLQRASLGKKGKNFHPHMLYLTATPIPRTMAIAFYGDLDVSTIDEMPPGRKPVKTRVITESRRLELYGWLRKKIREGNQVYIVFPLVEESEKLDLQSAVEGYQRLQEYFREFKVGLVHGKMRPAEKDKVMQDFKEGKLHILVSTTVIEVGVDVPKANIMIIENAERFGLSQLHQLRGRVGRGGEQAYTFLMTGKKMQGDAKVRLETMERTTDGFEIARIDLELRGPGDFLGTKQSGLPEFRWADFVRDEQIFSKAKVSAKHLIEADPELKSQPFLRKFLWDYIKKYNLEHLVP